MNVARKYKNTFDYSDMHRNSDMAIESIYKIENGLLRRTPTIPKWKGYFMAHDGKWYFAYRIENDTIYIEDVCHSQNMHESKEYKLLQMFESMEILKSINHNQRKNMELALLLS